MEYKYTVSEKYDPYFNLAYEKYLFDEVSIGETIIYLWQNDNTIVIGKNQNPKSEMLLDKFISDGGKLARRMSGGGTVYHDLGNLNFSFITKSNEIEQVSYQKVITSVLKYFGLKVEFNGKNDLLIGEKKFSGNATYDNGNIICQHGTLLVSTDLKKMSYYLTPDISKLERNNVKSVSSRVTNLSDLCPKISVEVLKQEIIRELKALKLNTIIDEDRLNKNIAFFSDEDWLMKGKR